MAVRYGVTGDDDFVSVVRGLERVKLFSVTFTALGSGPYFGLVEYLGGALLTTLFVVSAPLSVYTLTSQNGALTRERRHFPERFARNR
jgi:hypothetical protein